jgi:DNA-binding NarL/FixJ family response regulator
MFVRIGVFDPIPLFRKGIIATLQEAGIGAQTSDDVVTWVNQDQRHLVLLSLYTASDWDRLAQLCSPPGDILVVALLPEGTPASYARALTVGAAAALPRNAEPSALRDAVQAALAGRIMLPLDVLRRLASLETAPAMDTAVPSPRELEWLSRLAAGVTVSELASHAGYSERMMFRRLRDLYDRLQVNGRTEALLLARERGWL